MVVTLTYADEYLPLDNEGFAHLCRGDVQDFMRKLRYSFGRKVKIRYFIVGEYSPTNYRPHYHGIIFFPNDYITEDEFYMRAYNSWRKCEKHALRTDVTSPEAINYVSKYVQKLMPVPDFLTQPFALMSRKPGIGSRYIFDENGEPIDGIFRYHTRKLRTYTTVEGGAKVQLPRFYQDKIFSKFQKQQIKREFLQKYYPHAFEVMDKMGAFDGASFIQHEFETHKRRQLKHFQDKRKL